MVASDQSAPKGRGSRRIFHGKSARERLLRGSLSSRALV